eukprot:Colp12_sorted_trinity150504_noHs@21415
MHIEMAAAIDSLEARVAALKSSQMFAHAKPQVLEKLASKLHIKQYKKGDVLIEQDAKQDKMYIIVQGDVVRERFEDGRVALVDLFHSHSGRTFGALHLLNQDPSYATAKCQSEDLTAYVLHSDDLKEELRSDNDLAREVIYSLCREVREYTKILRTPLLEQHARPSTLVTTSIAASVESFYRSALNAILNGHLTGKRGSLFPSMHVQIPTRVVYINGLKGLRTFFEKNIRPEDHAFPTLMRLAQVVGPGVCMTPVSSILEASNAGHLNPEPLYRRWVRGIVPRMGREVVFGVGLNQLSDYCEERIPGEVSNKMLRNSLGSMLAGVMAAYFSHVPHNLSTMKLTNPHVSYKQHLGTFITNAESRVPAFVPKTWRRGTAATLALLAPKGVLIRMTQIVGSFIILNGTIHLLKDVKVPANAIPQTWQSR